MMGEGDDDCAQTGDGDDDPPLNCTFEVAGSRFGRAEEGKGEGGERGRRQGKKGGRKSVSRRRRRSPFSVGGREGDLYVPPK